MIRNRLAPLQPIFDPKMRIGDIQLDPGDPYVPGIPVPSDAFCGFMGGTASTQGSDSLHGGSASTVGSDVINANVECP